VVDVPEVEVLGPHQVEMVQVVAEPLEIIHLVEQEILLLQLQHKEQMVEMEHQAQQALAVVEQQQLVQLFPLVNLEVLVELEQQQVLQDLQ
tara:strand:- start:233 stop:505 length:273 start_codon:yes stop_codon:yes gene_type:complete